MPDTTKRNTRRTLLLSAAGLAGLAVLPRRSEAQGTATKASMQYQDQPKGKQDCAGCIQFVPGKTPTAMGTCKVVAGDISPHGWCIAFAPKPS
jgi:hypothetical protein